MSDDQEERLRRRGLRLAWFIVGVGPRRGRDRGGRRPRRRLDRADWIGIDSSIEVFAAAVVIWQLRGGPRARQERALRLIAISFFVLAAYVAIESARDLITQDKASESIVGIVLNAVALAVMVPVAVAQRRTGKALRNEVLVAQSRETWLSNYLSISLLVGLGLNAAAGLWWADPAVALIVAGLAAHSGSEAWREAREQTAG